MSYRNALFRKGLEVLSSEGIGGNDAKNLVNEAFNDNQQSYRQLSRSAGRLLNLIQQLLLTVKQMKAHQITENAPSSGKFRRQSFFHY